MKLNFLKYLFLTLVMSFSLQLNSQTKLYVHPDGDRYAFNTETIAILPLRTQVKLRPKEFKKVCTLGFLKENREVS